jgi:hypothetical protein
MADTLSETERQDCWLAMSELFVDNAVDYKAVAETLTRHCPNMSDAELRRTFFDEVAPVLGLNGLTPAPSIWTGFDGDNVVSDISNRLARRRTSILYRAASGLWGAVGRLAFRSIWTDLQRELTLRRQARAGS